MLVEQSRTTGADALILGDRSNNVKIEVEYTVYF